MSISVLIKKTIYTNIFVLNLTNWLENKKDVCIYVSVCNNETLIGFNIKQPIFLESGEHAEFSTTE